MVTADPQVVQVWNVVDPLLTFSEWVVFAITVSRLHQRNVFGNTSKLSHDSNKSNSKDNSGDPSSRSNNAPTVKDKAVQVMWKRRIFYTAGFLLVMSIRAVDPLATRFEVYIYINVACTMFTAMFGTLWVSFFAYSHLCAYHVAVWELPAPEWAPKAHRIYEIQTILGYVIFVPVALAYRRAYLWGVAYIVSSLPALLFITVLGVTVNTLYKRLTRGDVAKMISNQPAYEERVKKVKRFYILGNTMTVILLVAVISGIMSGVFCILDGASDLDELDPQLLSMTVWNGNIIAYIGLSTMQWIQWERRESAPRADMPAPIRCPSPGPKVRSVSKAASTARPTSRAQGDSIALQPSNSPAPEFSIEISAPLSKNSENVHTQSRREADGTHVSSEDSVRVCDSGTVSIASTSV